MQWRGDPRRPGCPPVAARLATHQPDRGLRLEAWNRNEETPPASASPTHRCGRAKTLAHDFVRSEVRPRFGPKAIRRGDAAVRTSYRRRSGLGTGRHARESPSVSRSEGVMSRLYFAMLMTVAWVNASSPSWPNSAPSPDCFAPPYGMSSPTLKCWLTQTVPES